MSSSESEYSYDDPDDHTYRDPSERKRPFVSTKQHQRPRKRAPPRIASAPQPRCLEEVCRSAPQTNSAPAAFTLATSSSAAAPHASSLSDTSEVVRRLIALNSALDRCSPSPGRDEARAELLALHESWKRYARVATGFELLQELDELREGVSRLESRIVDL